MALIGTFLHIIHAVNVSDGANGHLFWKNPTGYPKPCSAVNTSVKLAPSFIYILVRSCPMAGEGQVFTKC